MIGEVMHALQEIRVSFRAHVGSGATCFGIFPTPDEAEVAALEIMHVHPQWWVMLTVIRLDQQIGIERIARVDRELAVAAFERRIAEAHDAQASLDVDEPVIAIDPAPVQRAGRLRRRCGFGILNDGAQIAEALTSIGLTPRERADLVRTPLPAMFPDARGRRRRCEWLRAGAARPVPCLPCRRRLTERRGD